MKVTHRTPGQFVLATETAQDQELIDALFLSGAAFVAHEMRLHPPGEEITSLVIDAAGNSTQALEREAARKALGALRELFRLGAGQATEHRHVCAHTTDPQPQEHLIARVVELEFVVQSLGGVIGKPHLGQVVCSHGAPLCAAKNVPGAAA